MRCLKILMEGSGYPGGDAIRGCCGSPGNWPCAGRGPDDFEYQMLYGIRPQLQQQIADQGNRMGSVAYGDEWQLMMRRLANVRPTSVLRRSLLRKSDRFAHQQQISAFPPDHQRAAAVPPEFTPDLGGPLIDLRKPPESPRSLGETILRPEEDSGFHHRQREAPDARGPRLAPAHCRVRTRPLRPGDEGVPVVGVSASRSDSTASTMGARSGGQTTAMSLRVP